MIYYVLAFGVVGFAVYAGTRKKARRCIHCGRKGCRRHDYKLPGWRLM